jgi:ABC-type antimicrobial peptide transport system permease subunit
VLRLILGESLLLGLAGSLFGTAAAGLLLRFLAGWSFTRNFVHPTLSPGAVAAAVGLMLAAALAGSFYPAYRGASVAPTESLRFE